MKPRLLSSVKQADHRTQARQCLSSDNVLLPARLTPMSAYLAFKRWVFGTWVRGVYCVSISNNPTTETAKAGRESAFILFEEARVYYALLDSQRRRRDNGRRQLKVPKTLQST